MTIKNEDIEPGAVAILDPDVLLFDRRVRRQWQEPFRMGPFVCVHEDGDQSVWFSLTTRCKPIRLELRMAWLLDGSRHWRSVKQYLSDARKPYIGPNEAFIAASHREIDFGAKHLRPRVSRIGVDAILSEAAKYAEHRKAA